MKSFFLFFALVLPGSLELLRADEAAPLPVTIAVTDPNIRYIGRFDTRDTAGPRCTWSACTVELKFHGTDLNARIKDSGKNRWQVIVDGQPTTVLDLEKDEHLYKVAGGLSAGSHTVDLMKATEGFAGVTQFLGFQLNDGGTLQPITPPTRRLEVIGDSISCGYGDEAASQNDHFTPKTENAYLTYGALAARKVGADYVCIAFSGRKMWPNNTIPELYDRSLTLDPTSTWDFSKWTPDAIVINLATNDFGHPPVDAAGWTAAYEAFIARLRKTAPQAQIFCTQGPMLRLEPRQAATACVMKVVSDLNAAGDAKVHFLDIKEQTWKDGFGADWHPSAKTHVIMAETLVQALQADLGW